MENILQANINRTSKRIDKIENNPSWCDLDYKLMEVNQDRQQAIKKGDMKKLVPLAYKERYLNLKYQELENERQVLLESMFEYIELLNEIKGL